MDRKTRDKRKEKIEAKQSDEDIEQFATQHLENRIQSFKEIKTHVDKTFNELAKNDPTPIAAKVFYASQMALFTILPEIYELLSAIQKDMFAYDREYTEIKRNLKALGRTVAKPEYRHIQRLLTSIAEMERQTRKRPIDNLMYKG